MSGIAKALLGGGAGSLLICAAPVVAANSDAERTDPDLRPAAGTEVWASTDSDGTNVVKVLGRALWNFKGREKFAGIAVEHAWFNPSVGENEEDNRVYLDLADHIGPDWRWKARIGTDGDTVLGSAELRRTDWSHSFFVDREIVETDQGLRRKIYYTFAGASNDFKISDGTTLALTAGLQEFSGKNERLHLRGRLVQVLKAGAGLSAQLDTRYYHSTEPGEFDYYSPKDFVRILPLLQVRRVSNSGWMFLGAGGLGKQHSTGGGWKSARFAQFRLESPRSEQRFDTYAEIIYTNDSISGGPDYDYLMGRAGMTVRF